MDFVWFSEQTVIISLNSINHLVFVMKTHIFFEVGIERLNIIQTSFDCRGLSDLINVKQPLSWVLSLVNHPPHNSLN
jgi:hypothetical protein